MRRIVKPVVAVLLLAATSMAVAWVCSAFGPLDPRTSRVMRWADGNASATVMLGVGRTRVNWIGPFPPIAPGTSGPVERQEGPAVGSVWAIDDSGWPFRCMRATVANHLLFINASDSGTAWHGDSGRTYLRSLQLADEQLPWPANMPTWRALPLEPLWLGLCGNIAVYGLALAVPTTIAMALVRWRRGARGLCMACGYPLHDAERCPECGRMRSTRSTHCV